MSIFTELKRRNVVRAGITYIVVSWLLLQVGNTLFITLDLDASARKLLFAILLLGFIPALLFSWAYEITPEGIKHEKDLERDESYTNLTAKKLDILTIILVLMAMLMFGFDRLTRDDQASTQNNLQSTINSNDNNQSTTVEQAQLAQINEAPSIAVLPFVNMSANAENEYFSDGISEEILNALVRVDGLQVASRTSSFSFKDDTPDIPTIAEKLRVNHIVEGSVRRAGDQVRVTAQLIEVSTDKHLWSEVYTRKLEDVFAIQDEISAAIADALQLTLKAKSAERYTESIEAYDLYLKGLAKLRKANSSENFDQAITIFDDALAIDPKFAEAQAGRCEAFTSKYAEIKDIPLIGMATDACEKALAINPDAPQVLASQGQLQFAQGQYKAALETFNKAIALQPNFASAHRGQARTLGELGQIESAIISYEKAINLQPDDFINFYRLGSLYFYNEKFDLAADKFHEAIRLAPDYQDSYNSLGGVYFYLGEFGKAAETFRQSINLSPNSLAYSNAGTNYYYQGEYEAAFAMFSEAVKLTPTDYLYHGNLADSCRMLTSCSEKAEQHYQTALDLVEKQLSINHADEISLGQRALYLVRLHRLKESKKQLNKVLELTPNDPTLLYIAGLIAAVEKKTSDVKKYANAAIENGFPKKALQADPDFKDYINIE